jgi:hypothetical protein
MIQFSAIRTTVLALSALLGPAPLALLYRRPRWIWLGKLLAEVTYRLDTPDQDSTRS